MTEQTQPTDAEIDGMVAAYLGDCGPQATRVYSFARAALAKWGSPVVAGEVASHRVMRKRLDGNWVCDGRYWSDGPPSKELVESICSDKDRWRVDVAYTTPQPTNAQAGAVPLTCEWAHNDNDDDGFWETACGEAWRFDDGGPAENSMHFCHFCGKSLCIKRGQYNTE